jgi:hypothetical protein
MTKTRVFVSFDFDNDKILRDFIIGQAKLPDSPFEVSDHSLKEAAPERDWERKAHAAISRADKFITMLGSKTRSAPGVKKRSRDGQEPRKDKVPDYRVQERLS